MKKAKLIQELLDQYIWIKDGNEMIDWCNNCKRVISQIEIEGAYCCEFCNGENISIIELEE